MKIATVLNVHSNPELVIDTIESIQTHMTKDVLAVIDKSGINNFANISLPCYAMEGFWHNCSRSPFRNMTLGLKAICEKWNADWYCYMEYDVIVANSDFREDLAKFQRNGVTMVGNDHREANYDLSSIEEALNIPISNVHCLLGCCVFFHGDFIRRLQKLDFFRSFLYYSNGFQENIPQLNKQGMYDVAEVLYPSLAANWGDVKGFARWDGKSWQGNYRKYPMRFRPEINPDIELYPDATLIHPVKSNDHLLRRYYREKRKRTRIAC